MNRSRMVGLGLLLGAIVPTRASASSHCVIVTDINNTKNDVAYLDLASDPVSAVDLFVYLPAGAVEQQLTLSSDLFATSSDLLRVTGGGSTLVCAVTLDPLVTSRAPLRQNELVMSVPPMTTASGLSFMFPLDDVGTGAFLLIGDPGAAEAVGGVSFGVPGGPFVASLNVPSLGVQIVPIPSGTAATRVDIDITNGVPVIVQVLINGKGQESTMTFAEPVH